MQGTRIIKEIPGLLEEKKCIRFRYIKEHANLLNQIFKATDKNKIWVRDITYIPKQKKTLFLVVFVDIFSCKVVGWAMDTRMKDQLVIAVFNQTYGKKHSEPGLIVHKDQGAQFTGNNSRCFKIKKSYS